MAKADLKKKVVLDIPTTEEEKKKALQSAIAHITKVYGTGAIMRLGENKANLNVEAIPTGSMMLDMAMPANSAVQGRFDTNAEITAVAIMNMSTVSFALPFVMCMSVNTIFVGIFVFSSADVMPNDAKMKKITLLMKFAHTPGVPLYGKMPNPGMRHMSARPEMAMGTGSVTQSTMPDTMSAMAILPA